MAGRDQDKYSRDNIVFQGTLGHVMGVVWELARSEISDLCIYIIHERRRSFFPVFSSRVLGVFIKKSQRSEEL